MPRKKGTKGKRTIGKPAIRKCNAKNPRSIPDLSQITNLSRSYRTQSALNSTSMKNLSADRFASGEAAGSGSVPLKAQASASEGPSTAPLISGATRDLINNPLSVGALPGSSSNPITNDDMLAQIQSLTRDREATSSEPVAGSSEGAGEPNVKQSSSSEDRRKQQRVELETSENLVVRSPPRRSRKPPTRFDAVEPEQKPTKRRSIFEVLSRDTLQRYMTHYNIPKRQDLKKNLVARVQEHFDTIDHKDIDLGELTSSVRARLHQSNAEDAKKPKK